jgi:hypothetical protein
MLRGTEFYRAGARAIADRREDVRLALSPHAREQAVAPTASRSLIACSANGGSRVAMVPAGAATLSLALRSSKGRRAPAARRHGEGIPIVMVSRFRDLQSSWTGPARCGTPCRACGNGKPCIICPCKLKTLNALSPSPCPSANTKADSSPTYPGITLIGWPAKGFRGASSAACSR